MRKVLALISILAMVCVFAVPTAFAATYTLTVASSNPSSGVAITATPNDRNGQGSGTTQFTRSYSDSTNITLTAPATASGNTFQKWQRDGSDYSTNRTITFRLSRNRTMKAVFTTSTTAYTLTVASTNPSSGVAITVSPTDRNGASNGTTQFTRSYNSATVVSLTAPATSGANTFQKWQKGGVDYATTQATTVTMSAAATMTAVYVAASGHAGITGTFTTPAQVTAMCLTCHSGQGTAVVNSLHGMMPTLSPNVTNATGFSQKLAEINTFCSYPNPDMAAAACLNCHPTLGKFENLAATDIDCLQCHNDSYKRRFTPEPDSAKWVNVVDWMGLSKTYVPAYKKADGYFQIEFNWAAMPGITALDLVRGVKKPTTTTCLSCHAKAGGSDWAKRGDIGLNSATATAAQDVHLASVANGGAGLSCTSCHVPANHKIPGRGIDLRPTETGVAVKTCVSCHLGKDTTSGHSTSAVNRHVGRVACQACHIPQFGKGGATEMSRNWTLPVWNAALCNGQGAWAGEESKLSNVSADLAFFNGTSYVYQIGQVLNRVDPVTGFTMLAEANGGITDALGVSKLVPIKRHQSKMAVMNSGTDTGKVIPFDVVWQFMTGFSDQAAERGKTFAGYSGTHEWKWVEAEMAINHGVGPATTVACANCHGTSIINTSIDSKLDKLGYKTPKPTSDLCNDCHGSETNTSFVSLHDKHVRSEGYNCNRCHSFSRP